MRSLFRRLLVQPCMRMTSVMEKNGTLLLPKSIYVSHAANYFYSFQCVFQNLDHSNSKRAALKQKFTVFPLFPQKQPRSQMVFHKNSLPRYLYTITLVAAYNSIMANTPIVLVAMGIVGHTTLYQNVDGRQQKRGPFCLLMLCFLVPSHPKYKVSQNEAHHHHEKGRISFIPASSQPLFSAAASHFCSLTESLACLLFFRCCLATVQNPIHIAFIFNLSS